MGNADGVRASTSVEAGLVATTIALVLGTMVAFAVQRFAFFGRDTVSLLIVLPIAFRPDQAPIVNVIAAVLIVLSVLPVRLAQRIAGPSAGASRI